MLSCHREHDLLLAATMARVHQGLIDYQSQNTMFRILYEQVKNVDTNTIDNSLILVPSAVSPLARDYRVSGLSVCIPFDAMGNRIKDGVSKDNPPSTIEVAACDDSGNLFYSHPLLPDVARFSCVSDLLEFLLEIAAYNA